MKKVNFSLFIVALLGMYSCSKDEPNDPVIPNEEELITTMIWQLIPASGTDTVTFTFTDLDGDGGDAPVIVNDTLEANQQYSSQITLLNELEMPAENITDEVHDEASDHQFFYQTTGAEVTVAYNDNDGFGNPIGISTNVNTTNSSSGTITITLRHQPDKNGSGVAQGNIQNAGGETDIEVTFNVVVQ